MPRHQLAELVERIGIRTELFLDAVSHNADVAPEALNN